MHVVGTTALDTPRGPGAAVLSLAGDVVGHLLTRSWALVRSGVRRRRSARATPNGQRFVAKGALTLVERPRLAAPAFLGPADGAPVGHELALPADPTAPGRARALLQSAAHEWNLDEDLYEDAAMVVTELVANAVDHARTASTVTLGLDGRGLCVCVRDGQRGPVPRPRPVDPAAPRGRGLQMIAALACSWGVTTHLDGKTVWAVLPRPRQDRAASGGSGSA